MKIGRYQVNQEFLWYCFAAVIILALVLSILFLRQAAYHVEAMSKTASESL